MTVKRLSNLRIQYDDGTGVLASNYRLFFYAAGSSTKQNTYNSSTGGVANSNPIVLNALGEPAVEIWLTAGQMYKIGLAIAGVDDPPASFIWTEDNISGINDTTITLDEWVSGPAPTYVSATQFTLSGDQTTQFHPGRRLKSTVTAGTSYGTITAAVFGALTTVTVDTTGSNPLDSGLSAVSYGLLRADNFAQSISLDASTRQSADIASAGTLNLDTAGGDLVDVTGTTTITAITLARGKMRTVRFTGALTLTNGASLVLPGGANITTAAGDFAIFRGYAAGVVRCVHYAKASGKSVINTANTQPTRQSFTSGSGTYTTPANATRIYVRMLGGGAGGSGSGTTPGNSSGMTSTTFSTLTAANGAAAASSSGGTGGAGTNGDVNITGGSGANVGAFTNAYGGQGGISVFGGAGPGGPPSTDGKAAIANTGGGGGGGGQTVNNAAGGGGGAGAYVEKIILAPAATYSYVVGAGGSAGTAGTGGNNGGAGGSGIIIVDEFYD